MEPVRFGEYGRVFPRSNLAGIRKLDLVYRDRDEAIVQLQIGQLSIDRQKKLGSDESFSRGILIVDYLQSQTQGMVDELISPITAAVNQLYSDSCPANIFKNVTRCKAIFDQMSVATSGTD